jgi:hypothetical protein
LDSGLCFDDDLVFGINCGHACVTLDDAFAGGHLGGLVVGLVALADGSACAGAVVGVGAEPRADAAGFALQFLDALGFFGAQ